MHHATIRRLSVIGLSAASSLALAAPAAATLFETGRQNDYGFAFSNDMFIGAHAHIHVTYELGAALAGESYNVGFNTPATAYNLSMFTTGGIVASNIVIAAPTIFADVSCPDGIPGTRQYDFDVPALPAGPNCITEEIGGLRVLRWTSQAGGGLTGIPYVYRFTIPGDYSVAGTQRGQHELLGVAADWTIDQDFVYHADTNLTVFEAHQNPYSTAPQLSLRIYGAPVGILGDLNFDGHVDGADLGILLGSWAQPDADLNGDGTTDGADLGILLGAWTS